MFFIVLLPSLKFNNRRQKKALPHQEWSQRKKETTYQTNPKIVFNIKLYIKEYLQLQWCTYWYLFYVRWRLKRELCVFERCIYLRKICSILPDSAHIKLSLTTMGLKIPQLNVSKFDSILYLLFNIYVSLPIKVSGMWVEYTI